MLVVVVVVGCAVEVVAVEVVAAVIAAKSLLETGAESEVKQWQKE